MAGMLGAADKFAPAPGLSQSARYHHARLLAVCPVSPWVTPNGAVALSPGTISTVLAAAASATAVAARATGTTVDRGRTRTKTENVLR